MKSNLTWYSLTRDGLLALLRDPAGSGGLESIKARSNPSVSALDIQVGINDAVKEGKVLEWIVIGDDVFFDTLAWLYSFAEDFMPLGLHAKVICSSDLSLLRGSCEGDLRKNKAALSSLVIGEILMRRGSAKALNEIAVSWAQSSLLFGYARVLSLYGFGVVGKYKERIKLLEKLDVLSVAEVNQEFLMGVMDVAAVAPVSISPKASVALAIDLISHTVPFRSMEKEQLRLLSEILDDPRFTSDSVENRLRGFDNLDLPSGVVRGLHPYLAAFAFAAAAFLVGRGTSHLSLLNTHVKQFPQALMWFSLLAGMMGPSCWDPRWYHLVKRFDSSLNIKSGCDLGSGADLSWEEFCWILTAFDPEFVLKKMVRISNAAIAVDVVPGVIVHFRVGRANNEREVDRVESKSDQILSAVDQIMKIAMSLKGSLEPEPSVRKVIPTELKLEGGDDAKPKKRRGKK